MSARHVLGMMPRRLCVVVAALSMLAGLSGAGQAAAPQRIVAVGDLHGDFLAWTDIARSAGVEDASGHWSGGTTILVQLGDITDRGADSLKIINNLRQLQGEAPKAGGKVIVLLGNHEAMNATGDLRYVSAGEYAAFVTPQSAAVRDRYYAANKARIEAAARAGDSSLSPAAIRDRFMAKTPLGWVEHDKAWSPTGDLGRWARTSPAIVRLNGTLFAHGGISAEYSKFSLEDINRKTAAAMAKADSSDSSILYDPLGPLWYRGLVARDADAESARAGAGSPRQTPDIELKTALSAFGVKRLVVAHTPVLKGILIIGNGQLARIDTGNSRYYGGQLSWLEINGDKMIPHEVKRSAP
ncbi:MAG: metallophosphoesterase [Pseudomonadota bacterium]